jgi:hypothetical protein
VERNNNSIRVIMQIHMPGDHHLLPIVHAVSTLRLRLRLAQRREQHRSENRDNGDDDQQFDKSKSTPCGITRAPGHFVGQGSISHIMAAQGMVCIFG